MNKSEDEELEEILGGMHCPKDFQCYRRGFQNLCNARKMGIGSYLECQEDCPEDCKFSVSFGDIHFCECPLRMYIWKKLSK